MVFILLESLSLEAGVLVGLRVVPSRTGRGPLAPCFSLGPHAALWEKLPLGCHKLIYVARLLSGCHFLGTRKWQGEPSSSSVLSRVRKGISLAPIGVRVLRPERGLQCVGRNLPTEPTVPAGR